MSITKALHVMGATVPSSKWYFAEGCTSSNFEEWLCLQNPNNFAITIHATYSFLFSSQAPVYKDYTVRLVAGICSDWAITEWLPRK